MASVQDLARKNEIAAGLQAHTARRTARQPQPSTQPQFRTMADGSIMNQAGKIIYTPAVPKAQRAKG